jgi:hypothetical protein
MFRRSRLRDVVAATIIAALLMSGAAYGGSKITSAQIKDGTITGRDIRDRGITGRDLDDSTLSVDKLTLGALNQLKGAVGAAGPAGPAGPTGPSGTSSITRVNGPRVAQGAFGSGTEVQLSTATCPAGTYVTGGGFDAESIENFVGYAHSSLTQYAVIAVNEFSQAGSITAQAVCAGGSSVVASRVRSRAAPPSAIALARRMQSELDSRGS